MLPALYKLQLNDNKLSDIDCIPEKCPSILELTLSGNKKISSIDQLKPIATLKSLLKIDVEGCAISEKENYRKEIFALCATLAEVDGFDSQGNEVDGKNFKRFRIIHELLDKSDIHDIQLGPLILSILILKCSPYFERFFVSEISIKIRGAYNAFRVQIPKFSDSRYLKIHLKFTKHRKMRPQNFEFSLPNKMLPFNKNKKRKRSERLNMKQKQ